MILNHQKLEDKIYTSSANQLIQETNIETLNLEKYVEKELETVFTNHVIYWSNNTERLNAVSGQGTLYKIKGYDEDFLIGIYFETDGPIKKFYHLALFSCLNDITLYKGSDLYKDRYHLDESVRLTAAMTNKVFKSSGTFYEISLEEDAVQDFKKALYIGTFIDPESEEYPKLNNSTQANATLTFYDPLGLPISMQVYEKGYVCVHGYISENGKYMIIRVDEEYCKKIIELIASVTNE